MKISNLLKDGVFLVVLAAGGYFAYVLYQKLANAAAATTSAANSVGSSASAWTPVALASSVGDAITSGATDFSDALTGDNTAGAEQDVAANLATQEDDSDFINAGNPMGSIASWLPQDTGD